MAWVYKSNGELYTGETHELMGRTFTGKTRTPSSMPLLFTEDKPAKADGQRYLAMSPDGYLVAKPKKPRHSAAKARKAKFTKDDLNA
jgi:hypothetical protein